MKLKLISVLSVLAAAGVFVGMGGCVSTYYTGPVSDHFNGETFFNSGPPRANSGWDFWRWQLNREPGPWPDWVENAAMDSPPPRVTGDDLRVSYINHATVLIQTAGLNILTDPIYDQRASPVSFAGPKRVRAPGVDFDKLPRIDVVLVSHNPYAPLSVRPLARLWHRDAPRIIAPLGNDAIIRAHDDAIRVETLAWGQSLDIAPDVTVALEPMQHWSARTRWDTDRALWGAFVVAAPGGPIYFVGDTGYGDGSLFRAAADKYGPFRLALLPIGAYQPRWFMAYAHQTPEEAVMAHRDARACFSLATQHSTFPMADDGHDEPLRDLAAARVKLGVPDDEFRALMNGEHWLVPACPALVSSPPGASRRKVDFRFSDNAMRLQ
ncbi:MAG: MBL fold metallo-hydrolase [Rhodospirillaceae bacterium]|nr:MBL fold metallo-hydrolase [Rhodospirillaceae bacterium]